MHVFLWGVWGHSWLLVVFHERNLANTHVGLMCMRKLTRPVIVAVQCDWRVELARSDCANECQRIPSNYIPTETPKVSRPVSGLPGGEGGGLPTPPPPP